MEKLTYYIYEKPSYIFLALFITGIILLTIYILASDEDTNLLNNIALCAFFPCLVAFIILLSSGVIAGGVYVKKAYKEMDNEMDKDIRACYSAEIGAVGEIDELFKDATGKGLTRALYDPVGAEHDILTGFDGLFGSF